MCGNNIELASTWLLENDWQELETAGQQAAFDAIGAPANAEALGGDGVQDDDGDDDDDDDAEEVQGAEGEEEEGEEEEEEEDDDDDDEDDDDEDEDDAGEEDDDDDDEGHAAFEPPCVSLRFLSPELRLRRRARARQDLSTSAQEAQERVPPQACDAGWQPVGG